MKMNFIKYSLFLFPLIGLVSCDPFLEDKPDIGPPPSASFEIIAGDTPNDFILQNTTENAFLTGWDLGEIGQETGNIVEVTYPFKGSYDVIMTTYGRGGSASATKSLTVTQDDPNACFGNFKKLTGCGEKIWKIAPEEHAIHIGPNLNDTWWGNSVGDVNTRACHFDDKYIFRSNGEFEYENNGDFWADDDGNGNVFPPELAPLTTGCQPSSAWPESLKAWDSGIHTFSISDNSLTVIGDGAWIGLYKIGTIEEVSAPQSSVSFSILSMSDNRMVLFADYGWGVWRVTLVSN
jgi:hypothetical protein